MDRVKGKTAIITGAASGLGETTELLLAKEGGSIVVATSMSICLDGVFLGTKHGIRAIGKPIDIAYGVLYLASDEYRMVSGAEMVIDGGWTAW